MATILSLAEYKAAKGITGNESDAQISALLPMVNEFIEKYCNREFGPALYTEQNEGITDHHGFFLFHVKQKPIISVQSVEINYYGAQVPMTLDVTKLNIFRKEGYARFAFALNPAISVVRSEYLDEFYYTITYSGGAAVPQPVKLAAVNMLSDMFQYISEDVSPSGNIATTGQLKSVKIGDYAESYESLGAFFSKFYDSKNGLVLTKTVKDLLEPYRAQGQSVL